jgi:tRNA dimethylallyltransferase
MAGQGTVLIAGPTASGKSRLAVSLARERGGVVINADSMQVYRELAVLTARPGTEDEAAAPHRLYGTIPAATRYSVGAWLTDVSMELDRARKEGRVPIVVGGTGLYFKALTEGLAAVPPIPAEVRNRVRTEAEGLSPSELHARLASDDARQIRNSDRMRILRAIEVFEATGRSLARWQEAEPLPPLIDIAGADRIVLDLDRAALHRRIEVRAARMVRSGGMAEAAALGALKLDPELPAMKAIGVRELLDHLAGKTSLEEAIAAMATETRRYAKRQMTWFRNQMGDWPTAGPAEALGSVLI